MRPRLSPLHFEGIDSEAQMKRHFAPSYFVTHARQHKLHFPAANVTFICRKYLTFAPGIKQHADCVVVFISKHYFFSCCIRHLGFHEYFVLSNQSFGRRHDHQMHGVTADLLNLHSPFSRGQGVTEEDSYNGTLAFLRTTA